MKLSWLLWLASVLPQPLADQTCLATTVYLEARSEPALGQLAVAEVALRRRDRGRWGDSVCAVVSAPRQFAVTTTPSSFEIANMKAWNKAWGIAGQALTVWQQPRGKRVTVVPMADHFVKLDEVQPEWAKGAPLARIGEHTFFAVN